jgi:hypothetical protein
VVASVFFLSPLAVAEHTTARGRQEMVDSGASTETSSSCSSSREERAIINMSSIAGMGGESQIMQQQRRQVRSPTLRLAGRVAVVSGPLASQF